MEIWKDIKGYENKYQISNMGNVKSLTRNIILAGSKNVTYTGVSLCKNGTVINFQRHRLVAETFIEREKDKNHVNHKDGNKHNNNVDNLEWVTHRGNMKHAYENGMREWKEIRTVLKYGLDGNFIKEYETVNDAEKDGFNHAHIIDCCRNRRNQHGGCVWVYKEDISKIEKRIYKANNIATTGIAVIQMDLDGNEIQRYKTMTEPERFGFAHAKISACCSGKRKTHKGYTWKCIG